MMTFWQSLLVMIAPTFGLGIGGLIAIGIIDVFNSQEVPQGRVPP